MKVKTGVSRPIALKQFSAAEGFWKDEMELIRKEVLPYQCEILNDRVEGAAPSFCMRNFAVAGKMLREKERLGEQYEEPVYTYRGFEALPEDMEHLEDRFYGFVFQDSDFSKWIEAVAYSLANHPDAELERTADEAIEIVCGAQLENGYLDTYYIINGMNQSFHNLKDHHELYCFGHLVEGAVAYYQATGKDKLLKAAMKFADYIDTYFGAEDGKCKGYPGHEIAEMALVRLYEVTGEERYLKLSKFFINERGKRPYYWDTEASSQHPARKENPDAEWFHYYQAHRPVRQQDEAVGHAVRAMYLYSGMADIARICRDEELKEACKKLWNSVINEKMYITGGVGGTVCGEAFSFPYDLPNDLAYAETCAAIGLVFFARRMLELEPDAAYADVMELALYNGVLSGMALDGKSFFYVNPLEVLPEACHKDERVKHVKPVRQKWFGCACCPPNLARLISSLPSYAFTENEDTLYLHLAMSGKITRDMNGKEAVFQVQTDMPWQGNMEVKYTGKEPVAMTLAVRIPGWCSSWGIAGAEGFSCKEERGYYYMEGTWKPGDVISFTFEMKAEIYQADTRVRENIGKVAVKRGPVVYCAEAVDNGDALHLLEIFPEEEILESTLEIQGKEYPILHLKGRRAEPVTGLYHKYRKSRYEDTIIKMIPYYTWANRGENEMRVWLWEAK